MAWREIEDVSKEEMGFLRRSRKATLYADEDIEDEIVLILRSLRINIQSARELNGHRGKDDEFHAAYALREKRFLLTKNTRDYIDDHKLPWEKTFGVIAIAGDFGDTSDYIAVLTLVLRSVVPYGEQFERTKIQISSSSFIIKGRTKRGTIQTDRYRIVNGRIDQWFDE